MKRLDNIIEKLNGHALKQGVSLNDEEIIAVAEWIKKTPDIRDDKLHQIKSDIQSGKYNPADTDIASAIIRGNKYFDCPSLTPEIDASLLMPYLLKNTPKGKKYFALFHKIGVVCVADIFQEDLTSPLPEVLSSRGSKRFDLMLYNKAKSGFWSDMRKTHNITHVIFELKNWTKNDPIRFAEQIARYSNQNRAIVLVTRNKADKRIYHESLELFKKTKDFLPLSISDKKIYEASQLKTAGLSPSDIFQESYLRLQAG